MADNVADSELRRLEREAEATRARLRSTIADIKDPRTAEQAKQEVKDQAIKIKDELVDYVTGAKDDAVGRVRQTAQDRTSEFSRRLQRTAVENPIPVLLIGAGLGWHLYKKPPITTALLAAGAYGLIKNWNGATDERGWRDPYAATSPRGYVPGGVAGYGYDDVTDVASATNRVKAVAANLSYGAESAANDAKVAAQSLASQAGERVGTMRESLQEAGQNLVGQISDTYAAATERVQDMTKSASEKIQPVVDRARPLVDSANDTARAAVDRIRPAVERVRPLFDEDHRGQLGALLVLAGAGVLAGSLMRSTDTGRQLTASARDGLRDNWDSLRERVSDAGSDLSEQAVRRARKSASRLSETSDEWRHDARRQARHLRHRGADIGRSMRDTGSDHPVLLSAIGIAVGAILGGAIRQSVADSPVVREAGRALKQGAGDALREASKDIRARASGFAEGMVDATIGSAEPGSAEKAPTSKRVSA